MMAHNKKDASKKGAWAHGHTRHMGIWALDLSFSSVILPISANWAFSISKLVEVT